MTDFSPTTTTALIDTHCHLDAPEFDRDRDAVVERARAANVGAIVIPAINAATFELSLSMRRRYGCPVALGMHPIFEAQHREEHLERLRQLVESEKPIAIGEIGLDFFVAGLDPVRQTDFFAAQLKIARDFDLPVLLHVRKSQDQVLKQLRRFGLKRGIAHAFNGSPQQAEAYIGLGFKLGFGGNMSFERARNIRRLAADLPLESLVLETDSPDISPAWAYQERNEPAHLARLAVVLAELRNSDPESIAIATSANAREVLGLQKASNA